MISRVFLTGLFKIFWPSVFSLNYFSISRALCNFNDTRTSETLVQDDVLAKVVQNSLLAMKSDFSEIGSPQVLNPNQINENFENQELLNQHLTQKHQSNVLQPSNFGSVSQNENQDNKENNLKKFDFSCDICKKLFTCNEDLQNHEFYHMHGKFCSGLKSEKSAIYRELLQLHYLHQRLKLMFSEKFLNGEAPKGLME